MLVSAAHNNCFVQATVLNMEISAVSSNKSVAKSGFDSEQPADTSLLPNLTALPMQHDEHEIESNHLQQQQQNSDDQKE